MSEQASQGGSGGKQFPAEQKRAPHQMLGYGACALASALWGTGFYWGRLALNEMSVGNMVLYRFLFASLGMLPVVLLRPTRFTRHEWWTLFLTSAFGVPIQFLLQYHGLARTTVSHASLMVGAMPVLLAATAVLFTKETLDWQGWFALSASTTGVAMVVLGGSRATTGNETPTLAGDLLVIASLIVALAWIFLSKKLLQSHSAPVVSGYTIILGTVMLALWQFAPLVAARPIDLPPVTGITSRAWFALAISGLLCTGATTLLWNWGIHHVPASRAGVFLNMEPALGSILGVELLGEKLGPYAWLGGIMIIGAAVSLTTRSRQPDPEVLFE